MSCKNGRKVMRGGLNGYVNFKDVMDYAKNEVNADTAIGNDNKEIAYKLIDDLNVKKEAINDAITHMDEFLYNRVQADNNNTTNQMLFDDHVKPHIMEAIEYYQLYNVDMSDDEDEQGDAPATPASNGDNDLDNS